ncbi:MAG: methyltransferase domain-containing protein [Cytophagales bacterium]|nr:methyltransferase domain-containing protein [Cytophagales bacterium]
MKLTTTTIPPSQMVDHLEIFNCPICRGDLDMSAESILCKDCTYEFEIKDGIPLMFVPNDWDKKKKDVTLDMKSFYEGSPFPNYEDIDDVGTLMKKSNDGIFAGMMNEQIPFNIRVLEVGTGTGQLSNFLGIAKRHVFGADMTINSLELAQGFKEKHNLNNVGFYQMNLFKPIFREKSFPVVICIGVLHHTSDPFKGFQSISGLVADNGYIIIGLYHKYGRLITDTRRRVFNLTGDRFKWLDPNLKNLEVNHTKKMSWFNDQYKNPHESKHTIGEVMRWFEKTGFEYIYGIPNPVLSEKFSRRDSLFKKHKSGSYLDRAIVQLKMILTGSREGGFFILIGRKKKLRI